MIEVAGVSVTAGIVSIIVIVSLVLAVINCCKKGKKTAKTYSEYQFYSLSPITPSRNITLTPFVSMCRFAFSIAMTFVTNATGTVLLFLNQHNFILISSIRELDCCKLHTSSGSPFMYVKCDVLKT